MAIRISGLNSGLDTESIVSALVSSYSTKKDKYVKAQTKLSWTQDAWKSVNTKVYSLYSSLDALKYSSGYSMKKTTVSDPTKASVSASSSTFNGTQKLNVLKTAQSGYLTGGKLASSTTGKTTLAELGFTGSDGEITVTSGDGSAKSINVARNMTVNDFVSKLKDAGLSASYDSTNQRIYVNSKSTGTASDFNLTGSNLNGVRALNALGLNVDSEATSAITGAYAGEYDSDAVSMRANVEAMADAYRSAQSSYNSANAATQNIVSAYTYTTAYADMRTALGDIYDYQGITDDQDEFEAKLRSYVDMSASARANSVIGDDGNVYKSAGTDNDGSKLYSYTSGGNTSYIKEVTSYSDEEGTVYTKNELGHLVGGGKELIATGTTDDDGNAIYSYIDENDETQQVAIQSDTKFYRTEPEEVETSLHQIEDADGNIYAETEDGYYIGAGGKYTLSDDGTTLTNIDDDTKTVATADGTYKPITETRYANGEELSGIQTVEDRLEEIKNEAAYGSGMERSEIDEIIDNLANNSKTVANFENRKDSVLGDGDEYSISGITYLVHDAYDNGGAAGVEALSNTTFTNALDANREAMTRAKESMDANSIAKELASYEKGTDEYNAALDSLIEKITAAHEIQESGISYTSDAKKVDGQDAVIKLNGVEYTSNTGSFNINGMTINALSETGDGDENAINISTTTDVQGLYDKIKDFLEQYNEVVNAVTKLYNADSARGYEPLTDEQKEAMTDSQVEKWETKIKDSLLRRDSTLGSILNTMTSSMSSVFSINGKNYSLGTFGISTLGILNSEKNEHYAYHIDGDEDDSSVSSKKDKLMAALNDDPDAVIEFMKKLTSGLQSNLNQKMRSTTLRSAYTIYNDKEMASEYSDYTTTIKKWEQKVADMEDKYFKQFSAMEKALANLNSNSSSLTGLFG